MSTRGRQPLPQLQGLPLYSIGLSSDAQIFKHSDLRHKIKEGSIGFSESGSLGISGPKVNFFILGDNTFPPQALVNKALFQIRYGLEGEGL